MRIAPPPALYGCGLLASIAVIGIVVAIVIPMPIRRIGRSKQIRAVFEIRQISAAIEATHQAQGYGPVAGVSALLAVDRDIATVDPWSSPYIVMVQSNEYTVICLGSDGRRDAESGAAYVPGPTMDLRDDIVFENGRFLRFPAGLGP